MGLKYGERGTSEAMVPAESAGKRWGVRLTSRRRYSAGPCGRFRPREAARCPEGGPSPDSAVLPLPHSGAGPARRAARARAAGGGRRRSGRGARDCGTPRARTRRVVRP